MLGVFGGTFSSKLIGSVLDFFIGSMGLLGGAFGGFFGVASKMGGDSGPLEFGDSAPLVGESTPFVGCIPFPLADGIDPLVEGRDPLVPLCSGIWSLSWFNVPLTASEQMPFGAVGMSSKLVFADVSCSGGSVSRGESPVPFHARCSIIVAGDAGCVGTWFRNRTGARALRGVTAAISVAGPTQPLDYFGLLRCRSARVSDTHWTFKTPWTFVCPLCNQNMSSSILLQAEGTIYLLNSANSNQYV